MTDTTIPDYLQPAIVRLETARAAHLENARLLDETTTAIARAVEQKAALEQENGTDASAWRTAFRAGGTVLTDELKQRHIERVARRELVQECVNLAEVLDFESDRLKAACDSSARAYRQAHHNVMSLYAEHELDTALRESCAALVRAMKLKVLALKNPLANTIGHQGYTEPEVDVMQQVKAWLEREMKGSHIRLADEPVLYKTGLSVTSLPHMDHSVATTPGQRQVWQEKMNKRESDLKARGLL
ncbi:glycoprotein 3 [Salmonella enterica]|nr:glycoprotein 3 [Salmonella enterica]EJR2955499.1 glycoprotein 3 [Salmonella enterica]